MLDQRQESDSEYASFELVRGEVRISDVAKTVRFQRIDDAATTQFPKASQIELGTVPYVKYSSPYELIELEDVAVSPVVPAPEVVEVVEVDVSFDDDEPAPSRSLANIQVEREDLVLASDTQELELVDLEALDREPTDSDVVGSDTLTDLRSDNLEHFALRALLDEVVPRVRARGTGSVPTRIRAQGTGPHAHVPADESHARRRHATVRSELPDDVGSANVTFDTNAREAVAQATRASAQISTDLLVTSEMPRELVAATNIVSTTPPRHEPTELVTALPGPRASSRVFWLVTIVVLATAFALGLGIPFLVAS